jgi:XTP/dITP diphosphohydrolase
MTKLTNIVLATTNRGKLAELQNLFASINVELTSLADYPTVPEAIEDGDTFKVNARQKAVHYSALLHQPVLADDSGLEVLALNGAPGVYSARYSGSTPMPRIERDTLNNKKLLSALQDVAPKNRHARFYCGLCLCDAIGNVLVEVAGTLDGFISNTYKGENGFGYDPLFYIPSLNKHAAELSKAEKSNISHRGAAFERFIDAIDKINAIDSIK